jgi:hypothetical protein
MTEAGVEFAEVRYAFGGGNVLLRDLSLML